VQHPLQWLNYNLLKPKNFLNNEKYFHNKKN
jgi:hypothetical protein